jgi:hypothetical protein
MVPNSVGFGLILRIVACFEPVFEPGYFFFSYTNEPASLLIFCTQWGNIGKLIFQESHREASQILFEPPLAVNSDELPKYENLIREECLGPRGRLAELFGQKDVVDQTFSQALYEKRLQRQQEFKVWLFSRLQIFGYRDLYLSSISHNSNKIDERFDFPIQGTPAQFGVMLRQFSQTMQIQTDYKQLVSQVLLPGSRKDAGSIPPDANPIEVKLTLTRNQLTIQAHALPSGGTLLRVRLNGERILWELWDAIRDELEKLGWFSLPVIPEVSAPIVSQTTTNSEEQSQPINTIPEIWMTIPDVGPNREILRHWHKGLTCDQIAVRVSLSAKTILNRINKLRKEYGAEVVPYRKSNFIKEPRKKLS